jgi:hypothetical protein
MPVPLPECIRIKITRPMPDRKSKIRKKITSGVKTFLFLS